MESNVVTIVATREKEHSRLNRLFQPRVKKLIDKLGDFVPSDSNIKIQIKSYSKVLKTKAKVISQAGIFEAEVKNKNPMACLQKLEEQLLNQLKVWQESRHIS